MNDKFGYVREEIYRSTSNLATILSVIEDLEPSHRSIVVAYVLSHEPNTNWTHTPCQLCRKDDLWASEFQRPSTESVLREALLDYAYLYWQFFNLSKHTKQNVLNILKHIANRDALEHGGYMSRFNGLLAKLNLGLEMPSEQPLGKWINALFFSEYGSRQDQALQIILDCEYFYQMPCDVPPRRPLNRLGSLSSGKIRQRNSNRQLSQDEWVESFDRFLIKRILMAFKSEPA
jgi:hypothetical protein